MLFISAYECMPVCISFPCGNLAFLAQLDLHQTGDQEAGSATFFCGDHEIFSTVILSILLIQERHLSVSDERRCTILVNPLED